jgi:antitoxin ParD1/3/4
MRRYLLAPIAAQDLDDITTYISRDNPKAALKLLDSFFSAMDQLAKHPQLGHVRGDLTKKPVRFWPVKSKYLIIYKDTNPIEIVRVLSTYRDIATILT